MSGNGQDSSQWLSVTEETLFLHDGLIRVTDLVELPHDVNSSHEGEHEVVNFDSKSPVELSDKLMHVCGTQNNAYARLLEYRLNALRGFWEAQHQIAVEEQEERDSATQEETVQLLKRHGLWKEPEQASFSTRVGLLLVLPLLQSQSKFDPALCGTTAELLLNCLHDCPSLSLTKEPSDCLNGLESLLSGWLGESTQEGVSGQAVTDLRQKKNAASALIALACARGHLKTFIHTIHLLQDLGDLETLPVADMIKKLLDMEGGQGQPSSMLGSKHVLCWGFEDMLQFSDKEVTNNRPSSASGTNGNQGEKEAEPDIGRKIACDGKFLYCTNYVGRGLVKIGTGLHGTLRGYIYAKNTEISTGWLAGGDGVLLHRPYTYDKEPDMDNMAQIIDSHTLKPIEVLRRPEEYVIDEPFTTIALCGDGFYFYWIWCPGSVSDKSTKGQIVYLDVFRYDDEEKQVIPVRERLALQKKEESSVKAINETLLSRLRPYRTAAPTAALVTLTSSEAQATRKDDSNTSAGVPLKTLIRSPIYCDGSSVVLLTPPPGGSSGSTARSLFGSGSGLASLRSVATNLCFNVSDGQFSNRSDLIDAPTCALARGASVLGTGVCYDVQNNMIWSVSNDWVDQFYNPGHQAKHHILKRQAIVKEQQLALEDDNGMTIVLVVKCLLQHVGSMCLHQVNSDLLHTPLGTYILQQHPVDVGHATRVCDILARAIADKDQNIIICSLIVLQLLFKMSLFKLEKPAERDVVNRASALCWKILDEYRSIESVDCPSSLAIQHNVCEVLCAGLTVFYPEVQERHNLLLKLLTEGDKVEGFRRLRDLILVEFADQLKTRVTPSDDIVHIRLDNSLVNLILKIAVKESCVLFRQCQTTDRVAFEQVLSSVPMASPCQRYLMALQTHLLREALLYKKEPENKGCKAPPRQTQHDLQNAILSFASRVFTGAYEVLEVLLETCNSVINVELEDMEFWLQGLEKVAKATILGHLLPVLLTAMTHEKLRCLPLADALIPQLVQLVVLTSQAALLLKSQVQAIRQDDLLNSSDCSDTDIADLIGDTINLDLVDIDEQEEQGFLTGLKIPAPWTSGKAVESIHPVRDNYKHKETVHIPGARCLYLRFDPRSSSQYDYDKLVVYAGPNTTSRKVAEYGGNTFGYGSRSVLGSGWPKDLVKVEGDTVTFSFEMRSGREHNTPDKAMWGFLVTVRAQESSEEVSSGLPFLADLALGLSVLACTMLHLLYQGPEKTQDEEKCQHLLKSKLLQRCVWQSQGMESPVIFHSYNLQPPFDLEGAGPPSPVHRVLPRIRIPMEIVSKLRDLSEKQMPQIRPSLREVLQPDILEETILSAAIKHLALPDIVHNLPSHEDHGTEEFSLLQDVMSEVYRRLYAMIRQLQAIAELEQRWTGEAQDVISDHLKLNEVFFIDYHLVENKAKELAILCFLKDVTFDLSNLESSVNELLEKMESEVVSEMAQDTKALPKTKAIVDGLLEKLNLLLQVTISTEFGQGITRSTSHMPEAPKLIPASMVRSDTEVLKATHYTRSMSAPSETLGFQDDSVLDIIRLQRRRQAQKKGPTSILQDLVEEDVDKPPHVTLIEQLFSFMGSSPQQAVSSESFLAAASVRWKRGHTRQQALVHMRELLTAATKVGGATHLVAAVTSVLQHGPRVDELTCGAMVNQVREAFAETMTSVVHLAARFPIACCNSIGLLCIIPYTRAEEKCLVRSGLVHMLDKLCSLTNYRSEGGSSESQSVRQRVSSMAWAGFQVLSNRCVTWEQEDGPFADELEHSGLARQVSTLLTNHLARATECSGNEAAGNEALQEVLSLLNNLSRSRMGKAILSQPGCVSKLLSLLLDQRPSPKLVLIILQLCRVALPLMAAEDCDRVELPAWGQDIIGEAQAEERTEKPIQIASLLLAKLGDFLVPGDQTTLSSRRPSMDGSMGPSSGLGTNGEKDKMDDTDVQDGRLSVFVHKRDDQTSHEVIQPLLSSSENRPFRLSGGANMEKVVRMDREMTKHGKAEVTTEDAVSALRRAAKWAQMGLVVSTGPPVDSVSANNGVTDKKKTATEVICKEKNAELARTDPIRPFISGHVANSMATEVIALLHGLLTAPETLAAHTWTGAVEKVFSDALSSLNLLLHSVEDVGSPRCNKNQLMLMAKQANAALAALGGFEETIKPGCEVEITGQGIKNSPGQVLSVSEQTGLATVHLSPPSDEDYQPPRYSDTVQVPLSRLQPPHNDQCLPLFGLSMTECIVNAVQSLLLPQVPGGSPLSQPLPIHGCDASSLPNQICRVVAEIRTRACKVLSSHLCDLTFASTFIQNPSSVIDVLKSLAKECNDGERLEVCESQCQRLRMLYRDCAKPPPPPSKTVHRQAKEITWHTSRSFPPVRSCLFSHGLTGVTFLGDPSAGSGMPRGTIVYSSQPIPTQAPSFYWELEICSFGDSPDESGPIISFGFMPAAEKKDGTWTNPVGSCLFHNNGRAVHYNGSSLLQWKSVRLDVGLGTGDVSGVGWERQEDPAQMPGQSGKGTVYFTYNGSRLPNTIDDVSGGMWPVVHIQKKNTRIKANFGNRPFMYAEGARSRNAADESHDLTREIRETFNALPFHMASDSDSEGAASTGTGASEGGSGSLTRSPSGPPCRTGSIPKPLREYNSEVCLQYKLLPCYESLPTSGPDLRTQGPNVEDESDMDDAEDEQGSEDHYALLVKAWEQKVFPTIRRRFRNEAERKDGLEQIRGALQLGMTDIARQTVEFLYEENGGMPRDIHLPTIDDIKEELAKFTIERVRKGTSVVVRNPQTASSGSTVLPKFAIRGMLKTFGLMGTVLDVDQPNELVQVETYLRSEGILVRYWYPLDMLEKPPQGYRKSSMAGHLSLDTSSIHIHREILQCESTIARMHCRTALLELISQCNSPAMEVPSCSGLGSAMAASAALLQELDVENLQLLSNELLAPPQPHGSIAIAPSLITSQSPWQCIASQTCSVSNIFYKNSDRLKEELRVAIARAANQGEDYLIELSNQICMCLQTAPEMFAYEEIPVTESKITTDVHFPGAAFVVISCKSDPKAAKKDTSLYKSPWARVYTYRGHRVKKSGRCSKQEVVCFPRDTSSSSNMNDQYSPVIVPTDLVHVRLGVSPPPGVIVTIHAIPPQFSLAATYIETLVSKKYNFTYTRAEEPGKADDLPGCSGEKNSGASSPWRSFDTVIIPPPVLLHVIELTVSYLWRTSIPALMKEYVFHLIAQTLRVLHQSESGTSTVLPNVSPLLSPSLGTLMQLQAELRKLYDEETKSWPPGSTVGGSGIGLGIGDTGRFTTYFHSLMEVSLAVAEVTAPILPGQHPTGSSASRESLDSKGSADASPAAPTSPVAHGKRKKLKAKRERDRGSTTPKRSGSPRRQSESESSSLGSSGTSQSSGASVATSPSSSGVSLPSSKPEDMLWFHRALTMSQILRYLTYGDLIGQGVTNDAMADAAHSLGTPTAHQRLLVITGIPTNLPAQTLHNTITKVCHAHGGLYRDELYLPVEEVQGEAAYAAQESQTNEEKPSATASQEAASNEQSDHTKGSTQTDSASSELVKVSKKVVQTKGFAVIELCSKTKVEAVRKALLKSKNFLEGLNLDPNEPVDIPEEMLSINTVNQNLFAEEQGNLSLENYLVDKLMPKKEGHDLRDNAVIALTEIFHSCFITEQRLTMGESKHDAGYICFNREQIMLQAPGNLLGTYFAATKPVKKPLTDHVGHILHRYGIIKMMDKEDSEKKGPKGPLKKGSKPSKEKLAIGTSARTVPKKTKSARELAEKSGRDAAASDGTSKSTTKHEYLKEEERLLTLDGYLSYVIDEVKQDVRSVWRGLLACGFDLHFERSAVIDVSQAQQMCEQFSVETDNALVNFVNKTCQHLAISPARLHPHEIYFTAAQYSSHDYAALQGLPIESVRLRFALLQSLNNSLETFFLPLVDLRPAVGSEYSSSTAALLSSARGLIFFDTKTVLMNRVLNATAQRKVQQAAPEIILDPLEGVGGEKKTALTSNFCQALRQLSNVPSSQMCVRLAAGGDPTYSFNVKFTGEEVHGTSGSFRHFLWQVARELESSALGMFMLCPSSASHRNRGKYILKPGPMTYAEEKLLEFLGQLLSITMRADIPLGFDLLPVFWKNLVGLGLDPITDLQEADILTYNYIKKIEMAETEDELHALYTEHAPRFVYNTMTGEEVELIPNGRMVHVGWENRQQFVDSLRGLRMKELSCKERMTALRAGMATICPIQLLSLNSAKDAEMRICGLPEVDLDFLKAHTMYQVGLMETDTHIQYFWNVLESLSQDDLRRFIKFACNQERIPQMCPCRDGGPDTAHVPPYPMKIAPPDGPGTPDARYVRVETCMFMIKLPQYSTENLMRERLLYAIHCREDPLSG